MSACSLRSGRPLRHHMRAIAVFVALGLGLWAIMAAAAGAIRLDLPVRCQLGQDCFLQNYVDQAVANEGAGAYRDYQCHKRSYPGHKGTDFRTATMAPPRQRVAVVAAAAGTVRGRRDGEPDILGTRARKPDTDGKECGNGVLLVHPGGWQTQYCHLARGSVAVRKGEKVDKGQRLGSIGLSGKTQFPHAHLSVRNPEGTHIDPFSGKPMQSGCNDEAGLANSLWSDTARKALRRAQAGAGGILTAGIAAAPTETADILEGKHQRQQRLAAAAPAMVFWSLFYNLQQGDKITLVVMDPEGVPFVTHSERMPADKAQFMKYVGKRAKDGIPWEAGTYSALVKLTRAGQTYAEKQVRFTVGPGR